MKLTGAFLLFLVALVLAVTVAILVGTADGGASNGDATNSTLQRSPNSAAVRNGGSTAGAPSATTVQIERTQAIPKVAEVAGGGRIIWANKTGRPLTLRFVTKGAPRPFRPLSQGKTTETTFPYPGTYQYVTTGGQVRGSIFVH